MNAYDINDNLEKNQEDPNSYAFMYRRSWLQMECDFDWWQVK
jgi:hypothetical protein